MSDKPSASARELAKGIYKNIVCDIRYDLTEDQAYEDVITRITAEIDAYVQAEVKKEYRICEDSAVRLMRQRYEEGRAEAQAEIADLREREAEARGIMDIAYLYVRDKNLNPTLKVRMNAWLAATKPTQEEEG